MISDPNRCRTPFADAARAQFPGLPTPAVATSLVVLAAALALSACSGSPVKGASPTIGKAYGRMDEPSQDVLPIIRSEPIAIDPEKAAENYRKLLELTPDQGTKSEAQRRLADLQVQIEDSRGATEASEKGLQEAITLYNKLLHAEPDSKDNDRIFYQLARAQQNLGETEAAIETLKRLTDRHKDSKLAGDAHFRRAELLFALSRFSEAEPVYKIVMDLADATPFFEPAQYKYGWTQYKQSKYEEAVGTFLAVLDRELPQGELYEVEPALSVVDKAKNDMVRDSLRVITLSLAQLGGGPALSEYLAARSDPRFTPLLYAALGESFLEKERYSDAAGAYAAFLQRYPASTLAPSFQSRVIGAYLQGGFSDLVIAEKERYARTYDPVAPYWNGKPATAGVMTELRAHLNDLARHHHAKAQQDKLKNQAEFLVAAGWYRRILDLYPEDPQRIEINFLLGDSLLDGGKTLEAAQEYARLAYDYPAHPRSAEAAHASVLAYQQNAKSANAGQRPEALRLAIDAGIKLADVFTAHPQKFQVLTQSALDLYELKAYDEAVRISGRVLDGGPAVDASLRRIAWSVTGDSEFTQKRYVEAERAFGEELKLTPPNAAERGEIIEQLAASIYKQGEAARDGKDFKTAAMHFLRVGQVTPQASIRATSEYDGAAALIALEDWAGAARVLEGFRTLFPNHALEADVDKKLAVAYQRDNKPLDAARAFKRIGARTTETLDVRREAAWLAATLFDEGKSAGESELAYTYYVETFPRPLARTIEARSKLVEFARKRGDTPALKRWLGELVTADAGAGAERTPQSQALAARSSLELGRMAAADAGKLRLTLPIEKSLPARKAAMQEAIRWLGSAAAFGFADTTTAATYELGMVYQAFGRALLDSERPRNLGELELEQYNLLLEEQAYPFEEQAIDAHETNLRRLKNGTYDQWIASSAKALAQISPAKYGKREQGEDRYELLD